MKAAVCIDTWKLPTFKKTLDELGYEYTEHHSPKLGMITLKVEVDDLHAFAPIVREMNQQAANKNLN
jgi:hypothetical protein